MNPEYFNIFNYIAKLYEFDIKQFENKKSISLNSEYFEHKHMLKAYNLLHSTQPHLAIHVLNDLVQHKLKLSNTNIEDFTFFERQLELSKWYSTEFKSILEEALSHISNDITAEIAIQYQEIFDTFKQWFRIKTLRENDTFPVNAKWHFNPILYFTSELKQWYHAQELLRKQLIDANDNTVHISLCARRDKIDLAFSSFYFAFVSVQGIWLITDELEFEHIKTKLLTRKPERHREKYFETIPLPHNIFYKPEEYSKTDKQDIQLYKGISKHPIYKIDMSQFEECTLFIKHMIQWCMSNTQIFENVKQVQFVESATQKLLEAHTNERITKPYAGSAIEYLISDMLKVRNIDEDVNNLPVVIDAQLMKNNPLYDENMLVKHEQVEHMLTSFAREEKIKDLRKRFKFDNHYPMYEESKSQLKHLYNINRKDIFDRLFLGKKTNILREIWKKEPTQTEFNSDNAKYYIVQQKDKLVYHTSEDLSRLGWRYNSYVFGYTKDWGNTSDCECHHCIATQRQHIANANKSIYVVIHHWKELMWLFDIKKREDLPLLLQTYSGDKYDIYTGNSILNDIDPIVNIYNNDRQFVSHSDQETNQMLLHFSMCMRCYKRLLKNKPDEHNISIDYELLPDSLTLGKTKEYNAAIRKYNDELRTQDQRFVQHWYKDEIEEYD